MQIVFEENEKFKLLMSGKFLNAQTTSAFLTEVIKETIGPSGIAMSHFRRGQAMWPDLKPSTLREKTKSDKRKFVRSGRVLTAISSAPGNGKLRDWGSSADIYSRSSWTPKRYSANGIYAQAVARPKGASLTIGFNGRYKHSRGFNSLRRKLAKEKLGKSKVTTKEMRKAVSVGEVERRMRSLNADRRARGLKSIRKSAAMGSLGISGGRHALARGGDNLAYADIVQRGKFKGLHDPTLGRIISAKGISGAMRRGIRLSGTAVHDVARPLMPFLPSDHDRIGKALDRALTGLATEMNR